MAATSDYKQEVRIGVVMYGGVSLAIYMNGVTQELLNLVRATAPGPTGNTLLHQDAQGTEAVYRELSQRMQLAENQIQTGPVMPDAPVNTRFVIDLLSGTSAGGINAIFLAKALALDQRLDLVRRLWMEEAGLEVLINDKKSMERPLTAQDPPESLLSGDRLYLKLLGAFEEMDRAPRVSRSPYVDDGIDLFVTATDIVGLGLPLRLQYQQVTERRHKNVFHMRYRALPDGKRAPISEKAWPVPTGVQATNHFAEHNPFLAFTARCTSSFPFAFEPMTIERAEDLCKAAGKNVKVKEMAGPFFEDYQEAAAFDPDGNPLPYEAVPFGDGGYLDNKPFGPVLDALGARMSSLPSVRKLLYIEPSPEQHTGKLDTDVTFVDNVMAAAFTLPTYETIREDVQRVNDRNRLVERVRRINAFVEDDLRYWVESEHADWGVMDSEEWRTSTGREMVEHYGPGYGGYQRLRVSSTTDELAGLITRASGLNRATNNFLVVRELIRSWRNMQYPDTVKGEKTYNAFLFKFDNQYLLRRLSFVRARLNEMASGDGWSMSLCQKLDRNWPTWQSPADDAAFKSGFNGELARLKSEIAYLYRRLEREFDLLSQPGGVVAKAVLGEDAGAAAPSQATLGIDARVLASLRAEPTEASLQQRTGDLVKNLRDEFEEVDHRIAEAIEDIVEEYHKAYKAVRASANENDPMLSAVTAGPTDKGRRSARIVTNALYDRFEAYDLLSFPVLATSGIGEPVRADVIRISPREESALGGPPDNKRLAGTKLFNFGAFLERHWRENDMLWGRLQGAEQIIHAFVPKLPNEPADRTATRVGLIERAHLAILKDMIDQTSEGLVAGLIRHAIMHEKAATRSRKPGEAGPRLDEAALTRLFESCKTPEHLRKHYANCFTLDETVNPETALRSASRSSIVVGKMLEGVSDRVKPATRVILRASRALWATVEVSVPGSLWRKIFQHWSAVLLIAAALMILVGTLFDIPQAPRVGWVVVIFIMGATIASAYLKWLFERKRWILRGVSGLLAIVLLVLAIYGGLALWDDVPGFVTKGWDWLKGLFA